VADLEGAEPARLPPLGDGLKESLTVFLMWQRYYIMATPSPFWSR